MASLPDSSLVRQYLASVWAKDERYYHQRVPQQDVPSSRAISEPSSLNGHGIFAIIVFACVTLIVIYPIRIPFPFALSEWVRKQFVHETGPSSSTSSSPPPNAALSREASIISSDSLAPRNDNPPKRYYFTLNHVSAPMVGILLLLATKTIGGEEIKLGIVGDEGVEPYDVLALFISLAYIAISVDATGLLRYLAFHVSLRGGRSGPRLFYLLYLFFFLLGLGVGNDPVILSGTAFLVYFTRIAGITRPDAWIWAQFAAANISSATLVSSNPTNLVIASGGKITFPIYSAFMALPTVVSGLVALITIRVGFINRSSTRKNKSNAIDGVAVTNGNDDGDHGLREGAVFIPPYLIPPDVDPRSALVDPIGAIFGTIVMGATLAVLIGTSVSGHVKVFQIALPGAALCLIRDAAKDAMEWKKRRDSHGEASAATPQDGIEMTPQASTSREAEATQQADADSVQKEEPATATNALQTAESRASAQSRTTPQPGSSPPKFTQRVYTATLRWRRTAIKTFPTISLVMSRLPFPLLPFAFGMFILVQSLAHVGFVNIMAGGLGKVCGSGREIGTAFFVGFLSVVLCSLGGTNIGACILLVRAFQGSSFTSRLPPAQAASIHQTALYSLALGSNIGAMGGTFAASLAGLLWRACLKQGGIHVYQRQFLLWSIFTTPLCLAVGLIVIWAQVMSGKWPV